MNQKTKIYWYKVSFLIFGIFIFTSLFNYQVEVAQKATDENFFNLIDGKVVVTSVFEDGVSDRAGMKVGDVIIRIDDQSFITHIQADSILRSKKPGSTMKYDIVRSGKEITLYVTGVSQITFYNFFALFNALAMLVLAIIAINKGELNVKVVIYAISLVLSTIPVIFFLSQPYSQTSQFHLHLNNAGFFFCIPAIFHSLLYTPRNLVLGKLTKILIKISYISGGTIFILSLLPTLIGNLAIPFVTASLFQNLVSILIGMYIISIIGFNITGNYKSDFFRKDVILLYGSWIIAIICVFFYLLLLQSGTNYRFIFVIPIFGPLITNYYYFIKKRFFNIDVVVNRSVKYQTARLISIYLLMTILFITIAAITNMKVDTYQFNWTYTGIEISDKNLTGFSDRPLFIFIGMACILLFMTTHKIMLKWINKRFSRDAYNYKNALTEINALLSDKYEEENAFNIVVKETQRIMRIKGVSLLIKEEDYIVKAIHGFSDSFKSELQNMQFPVKLFSFDDTTIIANHPIRNLLSLNEIQLIVPLKIDNTVLGYFLLGEKNSEDVFNQSDIEFIESVSTQVIILLENTRLTLKAVETEKIHHELQIAKKLQMNLLPKEIPSSSSLEISTYYTSAREVGGDYYDIIKNDNDDILFVLGDVSGKGITASLYMSRFQGIMRSFVQTGVNSPRELLVKTNAIVHNDIDKNSFVTCLCATIDKKRNGITFSRAGHLPLFHYSSKQKKVLSHEPKGIALGAMKTSIFDSILVEDHLKIEKNDIFIICSDGVTEAMDSNKEEYGFEKFINLIEKHHDESSEKLLNIIMNDINEFVGNTEPSDDIAIILIKVLK